MHLQEFPHIDWIREHSHRGFKDRKDYHGNLLEEDGWPNAIVNVKSGSTERNGIKGPFSLFYNLNGKSAVKLSNGWNQVSDFFYCISNEGEVFDLHIPEGEKATTFNIHFGKQLYEEVVQHLTHSEEWSLDNYGNLDLSSFELLPNSHFLNEALSIQLSLLHSFVHQHQSSYSYDQEYEILSSILETLLRTGLSDARRLDHSSAKKLSTRVELFRRVNIGLECIHSSNLQHLDLDGIAQSCGLSKYHFIRVFRELYGQTPMEYVSALRAKKARSLIASSNLDLTTISLELGFSELSAFTRFFKRQMGVSPSSLRSGN